MVKQKLVIFIDWYFPAFKAGGPVQSIDRLTKELCKEFDISIITGNLDVDGAVLKVVTNQWVVKQEGFSVIYLTAENQSKSKFEEILDSLSADVFYVNGIFSFSFSILPLIILRLRGKLHNTVIAPRGMLGKGALKLKAGKKKLFLILFRILSFAKKVTWHSTSEEESSDIRSALGEDVLVTEIANFPRTIVAKEKAQQSEMLRLFFYSRISKKKNLKTALRALQNVTKSNVIFSIYGPIEDAQYWQECTEEIAKLPKNITAEYKGVLKGNEIEESFANEDVLFLPTLNENYGHAIVESLYCGCPVIISDQTPWLDLKAHQAGFALPVNDYEGFAQAIEYYAGLTKSEKQICSKKAIDYISSKVNVVELKTKYSILFNATAQNRLK